MDAILCMNKDQTSRLKRGAYGENFRENNHADIGKSTGPRSLTSENSGGPMKTLIVPVLLSGKKNSCREPSMGTLMLKKLY